MSSQHQLGKLHRLIDQFVMRRKNPNYDQYMTVYKFPQNAKIVVLGGQFPLIQNLIQKQFNRFTQFSAASFLKNQAPSEGVNEKQVVKSIGKFLLKGEGSLGHILTDFPQTVEQAKGLDEILDGVNLAIRFEIWPDLQKQVQGKYVHCKSCGKVFNLGTNFSSPAAPGETSTQCEKPDLCELVKSDQDFPIEDAEYSTKVKELENYYAERGLLLRFRVCPKKAALSFEEVNQKLYDAIEKNIKL